MPNLLDHVVFRAKLQPRAIASQRIGHQLTFAQMMFLAKRFAAQLRKAGVQPGQVVVTAIPDKGLDWLLTLALFHEGAITCSLGGYEPWKASFAYDWLVTDRHDRMPAAPNLIVVEDAPVAPGEDPWALAARDYPSADSVVRVILTSGTTGQRKGVPMTIRNILGRVHGSLSIPGGSRILSTLAFSTASDFNAAVKSLVSGTPHFVSKLPADTVTLVREHRVECLLGSPATLSAVVAEVAKSGRKLEGVKAVRLLGATAPIQLLAAIESLVTRNIFNLYGSTEAGGITACRLNSRTDPAVAGHPQVDTAVEAVDADDQPLPAGQAGSVRTRAAYMADGYFRDEEATAKVFRNGWFYSGDTGFVREDGQLVLGGRESEIINAGGVKVDPTVLDRLLQDCPGVQDAAVFSARGSLGMDLIVAAIVAPDEVDVPMLQEKLRREFGAVRSPSVFVRTDRIPRNATGKLMRAELSERFAAGELTPV